MTSEPWNLALAILIGGLLVFLAALATRATQRVAVPLALLFLGVGMLAGSDGIGGIQFTDHVLAYRLGTLALVLILFDGGLATNFHRSRPFILPSTLLATLGVGITAAVITLAGYLLGLSWIEALIIAAVVSSTDAAAVFSVLRGSGISLQPRVSSTIELESGLNDPMAVILTAAMVDFALTGSLSLKTLSWQIPLQFVSGTIIGVAMGYGCRQILLRLPPAAAGLLPVVTTASAAIAYGAATLAWGSGFLAVYVCGLVLGHKTLPDHAGIRRVHDFIAWLSQVALFLTLGLLVFPSQLDEVAWIGIPLTVVLVVVARPLAVAACLRPFKYTWHEITLIGWVGLRGAVPIVLVTYPVLVGVTGAERLFNIVFFVVVVSVLIQSSSVKYAAQWLGLDKKSRPKPEATIEIVSMRMHDAQVLCYHINEQAAVAGVQIAEVPFPPDASIMMIVRGNHLVPARGSERIKPSDHVYIFCKPSDEPDLTLWFGQRIDD
jgi:potassium/hydrogen antiporter